MDSILASETHIFHALPDVLPDTAIPHMITESDGSDERAASTRDSEGGEKWIWVLDPMTRKLRVPEHLLVPTQATSVPGTVPSLCIAYLEGRCRHPWCRQAHILPSAIPQLRYEALSAPTCCHLHKDPQDISMLTNRFKFIRILGNGPGQELIPTDRVACTVGLRRYLVHNVPLREGEESATTQDPATADEDSILDLPPKFICRLHLAHRCRYLDDCNNIHICRDYELRLQPPPHMTASLAAVTTSTRTVVVGETCYTVTPLAVGEVTDDDFNAITEAQKIHLQCVTPASSTTGTGWMVSAPHDSVTPSSGGNSPMPYANAAGLPNAFAADAPMHLRVYDVRGRSVAQTPLQSSEATPLSAGRPALPKYNDVAAGKPAITTTPANSSQTAPHLNHTHQNTNTKTTGFSYSTEGGISLTASSANTPLADGGPRDFHSVA